MRDGYEWAARLRSRLPAGTDPDAVPVRLLGRPALLVRGPQGVRFFTDTSALRRQDATPAVIAHPLFGVGAVHGLDDQAHLRRKEYFVRTLEADPVAELVRDVARCWRETGRRWTPQTTIEVEEQAVRLIGDAVTRWAGLRRPASEVEQVSRDLATIVDGFAVPGPAYLRARAARRRTDRWASQVVAAARDGMPPAPAGSALARVARWTDCDGEPLPVHTAAVELQNVLRPTVAVSRFVAFAALALAQHASWRERLRDEAIGGPDDVPGPHATAFAQEVRRLTPFVPLLAATARHDLEFAGVPVPDGSLVLLDVVGTLRDPRWWRQPLVFDPDRFLGGQVIEPDAMVPQGGGLVDAGHRCPGEDTATGIIAASAAYLARRTWHLPPQNLRVDPRRMPTRPRSGVRITLLDDAHD
jgi:fatty-acid peroxygenase